MHIPSTRTLLAIATLLLAGACAAPAPKYAVLDHAQFERILGQSGVLQNGEFKVTVPQNDLEIQVDGFSIIPPMGLGSWAAFTPGPQGAVLMGDLVVKDAELAAVQMTLIQHGLTVTGLHNHFARETPSILFMHIGGEGSADSLALGVRAVLDRVRALRGGDPAAAPARSVSSALDTAAIALGLGASVSSFLGFNTWAAWQGTEDQAAVAGDFAMLADEVAPVVEALVTRGIEVVALHNHMTHEQPTIYFLHYWGVGRQADLLAALQADLLAALQAALASLGPAAG